MDITVYENILDGMKEYNNALSQNYGNTVVATAPSNPTYPLTVFDEIRNVANVNYNGDFDRLASMGYRADVYAKTKGNVTKQTIARKIAQEIDNYLSNYVGLNRVSYNVSELENDGSIYHIIITYEGTLHENRRKFI
ncbi:MAG: hypothetical protein IKU25_05115 [Clostridia bacterium]|nr:hypothetical protein [Clostridia bacterium]